MLYVCAFVELNHQYSRSFKCNIQALCKSFCIKQKMHFFIHIFLIDDIFALYFIHTSLLIFALFTILMAFVQYFAYGHFFAKPSCILKETCF